VFSETAPAVIRADAGNAFAPLALERGTPRLAERARELGVAALSLVNAYNVAALWPEVERLAADGLAALAFTASLSYVAPAGGTQPLFGTNPMAFGWPREGKPPVVFDQASSASARGEIQVRLRDGREIPEGWAVDRDGQPTTDPAAALDGAQLPFGGHKGSSIALMIELLAGALLGDLFSFEASTVDTAGTGAPRGGELILAFAPERFVPGGDRAARLAHAEQLFTRILAQEGTRLPGDRRYAARRESERDGVSVPRPFYEELESLAR
jgi:LDH2 family malate/lactate/ureidoglycolate dehydrogenase